MSSRMIESWHTKHFAENIRMSGAKFARILFSFTKTTLSLFITPLVYVGTILVALVNTLRFCLVTPVRNHVDPLVAKSRQVRSYGEWRNLQLQLDETRRVRKWSEKDEDPSYDWRGLQKFKENLEVCRRKDDVAGLRNNLRAQATRNVCSMLSPWLYLKSSIQTKKLIHEYVYEMCRCIGRLARREHSSRPDPAAVEEEKRRLFSDARQIMGRTTLVLQGGAMLSMCHLGVIKALHRRRLLPRIITATGTGALVAAIVGCVPDDQLLSALEGQSINIDAFIQARERRFQGEAKSLAIFSWIRALIRRVRRFCYTGHFFEIDVLAQCARDNIGDVTFEEAYAQSGRILNITIAKPDVEGTPQLLNYITAPHVVVWSAVAASVASSKQMFAAAPLKCKNDIGLIVRYFAVDSPSASNARSQISNPRIPMERIGELFDVNHYIVSQTRPYIIPFVRLRAFMCGDAILGAITRVIYCEILHRLDTLSRMGLLPTFAQRILIDELIPSTSSWSKFVVAPEISFSDYFRIFNFPSPTVIDEWAIKGERSVWPKICAIKIRCSIEFEIDNVYRKDHVRFTAHAEQSHPTVNGHHG